MEKVSGCLPEYAHGKILRGVPRREVMKILSIICLLAFVSCAHDRHPASRPNSSPVAYDTAALGNVLAYATKRIDKQDVCFDINLEMKGARQQDKSLPSCN